MLDTIMEQIYHERPKPLKQLDQVHMDPESINRTRLYLSRYVGSRDVLIIGDDDLMSLVFSWFCNPANISVLDIDSRIISHIRRLSKRFRISISTRLYDVIEELPREFRENYDFFYTNPPYGSKNQGDSCIVFIQRGIECCRVGGYGAFVIASSKVGEWARIAKDRTLDFVSNNGCRLVCSMEDFQSYIGNPIKSSLYIIQKEKIVSLKKDFIGKIELY